MPAIAANHPAAAVIGGGLLSAETIALELRTRLAAQLQRSAKRHGSEGLLELARGILAEFEPLLAETLAESELAAWVAGTAAVYSKVPTVNTPGFLGKPAGPAGLLEAGAGSGMPPEPPLTLSGALGWDEPAVRFPLIEEAANRLLQRGAVTRPQFDAMAEEAWSRAFTVAYQQSTDVIAKIRDALAANIEEGASLGGFRAAVEEAIGKSAIGPAHLENVYRTNIQGAFQDGHEALARHPVVATLFPYREYLPIHDARVRHEHLMLGKLGLSGTGVYRSDDKFWEVWLPPNGFNCFLPGTIVQGRFNLALKSWYSGDAVEIVTRSGNRLSVTTNHPVLTEQGFVPAKLLAKGGYVLGYRAGVEGHGRKRCSSAVVVGGGPENRHKQHAPAPIEEVFGAIANLGRIGLFPLAADDLHGDAQPWNGQVEVVGANRELLHHRNFECFEGSPNLSLSSSDMKLASVASLGLPALGPHGSRFSSLSCANRAHPFFTANRVGQSLTHLQTLYFGQAANLDASLYESPFDGLPAAPNFLSQFQECFSSKVASGQQVNIGDGRSFGSSLEPLHGTSAANLHARSLEAPLQSTFADARLARELCDRFPGEISPDEIVEVRKFQYCGHVYDLQSPLGFMVSDSMVVSNCRCGTNLLSITAAAAKGVLEAQEWLRTGVPPEKPEYRLPFIPFQNEPGFGGPRAVRMDVGSSGAHWITIGGREADGEKHKGGFPVQIDKDGNIIKSGGMQALVGKNVREVHSFFQKRSQKGGPEIAKSRNAAEEEDDFSFGARSTDEAEDNRSAEDKAWADDVARRAKARNEEEYAKARAVPEAAGKATGSGSDALDKMLARSYGKDRSPLYGAETERENNRKGRRVKPAPNSRFADIRRTVEHHGFQLEGELGRNKNGETLATFRHPTLEGHKVTVRSNGWIHTTGTLERASWKSIVKEKAAEHGMTPEEYDDLAQSLWRPFVERFTRHEHVKKEARDFTKLDEREVRRFEDKGLDYASGSVLGSGDTDPDKRAIRVAKFDEAVAHVASEGHAFQTDDHEQEVWDLIKEGRKVLPFITSPEFVASVDAALDRGGGGGEEGEDEKLQRDRWQKRTREEELADAEFFAVKPAPDLGDPLERAHLIASLFRHLYGDKAQAHLEELVGDEAAAKMALQGTFKFDPDEHPRAKDGEFAKKGGGAAENPTGDAADEKGGEKPGNVDDLRSQLSPDAAGRLGTKAIGPITLRGYRVGPMNDPHGNKRGVHFAGDEGGARAYSSLHPGRDVKQYDLKLSRPLLAGHQNDLTLLFFKKTYLETNASLKGDGRERGWKLDRKIAEAARKAGFDSIIMLKPAPPANSEVVLLDQAAAAKMSIVQMALGSWDASKHPRGPDGRFIVHGSSGALRAARATVKDANAKPGDVLAHAGMLSAKQLRGLTGDHGVDRGSGVPDELVQRLAARLDPGQGSFDFEALDEAAAAKKKAEDEAAAAKTVEKKPKKALKKDLKPAGKKPLVAPEDVGHSVREYRAAAVAAIAQHYPVERAQAVAAKLGLGARLADVKAAIWATEDRYFPGGKRVSATARASKAAKITAELHAHLTAAGLPIPGNADDRQRVWKEHGIKSFAEAEAEAEEWAKKNAANPPPVSQGTTRRQWVALQQAKLGKEGGSNDHFLWTQQHEKNLQAAIRAGYKPTVEQAEEYRYSTWMPQSAKDKVETKSMLDTHVNYMANEQPLLAAHHEKVMAHAMAKVDGLLKAAASPDDVKYDRTKMTRQQGWLEQLLPAEKAGVQLDEPAFFSDRGKQNLRQANKFLARVIGSKWKGVPAVIKPHPDGERARAHARDNDIVVGPSVSASTLVHEFGHVLEHQDGNLVGSLSKAFAMSEVAKSKQKLDRPSRYEPHEVMAKDGFLDAYIGKFYPQEASEVLSMGLQYLYEDPLYFYEKSPAHFRYTLAVLHGLAT